MSHGIEVSGHKLFQHDKSIVIVSQNLWDTSMRLMASYLKLVHQGSANLVDLQHMPEKYPEASRIHMEPPSEIEPCCLVECLLLPCKYLNTCYGCSVSSQTMFWWPCNKYTGLAPSRSVFPQSSYWLLLTLARNFNQTV